MEIKTLLRKGSDHVAMCQDHFHFCFMPDFLVMSVFDGCSSGLDSHFASNLYGKVLKGVLNEMDISLAPHIIKSESLVKYICDRVYRKLKDVSFSLGLKDFEVLSTMILAVVTSENNSHVARVMVSGDGLISVDGKHYKIDSNNQPDYMSYHFEEPSWSPSIVISVNEYVIEKDFSICSDGMM